MTSTAWMLCGTGVLFCLSGIYFFYRNAFEENRKIGPSILLMVMGIILITAGTAKYFHLIK